MTTGQSQPEINSKGKFSSLGWFILLSLIAHGLGVWFWSVKLRSSVEPTEPQASTPIDFVVVPPEETPTEPPPETERIAPNDSVAKGEVKPELPPQTNPVTPPPVPPQLEVEPQPQVVEAPSPEIIKPTSQEEAPVATATEPERSQIEQPSEPPASQETRSEIKPPPEIIKPTPKKEIPVAKAPDTRDSEIPQPPEITKPQLDKKTPIATPTESTKPEPKPSPIATNSAPPKPQPKAPPSSGAASLLGTESRNIAKDGNDFFFPDSENASQQALNPGGIDARRDPNFAAYFAEIRRKVRRNWQPSSPGEDKQTVLAFSIQPNGQITDLRVTQSSGSPEVDRESLAAVQNAAPFSALPADFPEPQLDVEFNFNIYIDPRHWQRGLNNW